MWQYDPSVGDMVWVEPAGATAANVPANIASLVPAGGTVQQNMAASLQGYGAEGGEMSFNPDGTFTISTPLADNQFLNTIVDSSGKQLSQNVSSGKDTGLQDLVAFATIPLTAGGAGGVLGGALTGGALTGTSASALGNALISGGAGALTGQDPLKAALLSAGGTYAGSLFGGTDIATKATDAQNIAEYAQELAAQGLPSTEIERILKLNGVASNVAGEVALSATDGTSLNQIVSDITKYTKGGLFTEAIGQTPVTPTTVSVSPEGLQTVTATGSLAPIVNAGGLLGGLAAAVPSGIVPSGSITSSTMPALNEQVTITGTAQQKPVTDNLAAALTEAVNPVTTAATTPTATDAQKVEVTGTKDNKTIGDVAAAINAGTLYGPGMTGTQTTVYDKTLEATDSKTAADTAATLAGSLTLADLLKVFTTLSSLGMLGGGGGGGAGGTTTMTPTTPVPVGNTDYYKAIQQYYNTYMPQTPRDVATPLQQWYEGKFGG